MHVVSPRSLPQPPSGLRKRPRPPWDSGSWSTTTSTAAAGAAAAECRHTKPHEGGNRPMRGVAKQQLSERTLDSRPRPTARPDRAHTDRGLTLRRRRRQHQQEEQSSAASTGSSNKWTVRDYSEKPPTQWRTETASSRYYRQVREDSSRAVDLERAYTKTVTRRQRARWRQQLFRDSCDLVTPVHFGRSLNAQPAAAC